MAVRCQNSAAQYLRRTMVGVPSVAAFTLMGWARIITDLNYYGVFLAYGTAFGFGGSYVCGVDINGTTLIASQPLGLVTGSALTVGAWYHVAMTVSGTGAGQFLVYLDGSLAITNDGNAGVAGDELNVATDSDGFTSMDGEFSHVKMWDAVLTPGQILAEVRSPAPVLWTSLYGYWPLWTTAYQDQDLSGNGNDFDLSGGSAAAASGPPTGPLCSDSSAVFGGGGVVPSNAPRALDHYRRRRVA